MTQCRDHNKPRKATAYKGKPKPTNTTSSRFTGIAMNRTPRITKRLDVMASKNLTLEQLLGA